MKFIEMKLKKKSQDSEISCVKVGFVKNTEANIHGS